MQSDYRVVEIFTEEETGDVIAKCYDVLYGEYFEKYLGQGDDFDGKENASNLLNDSNYEISTEIRQDIEDIFGVAEFDGDQDYDGYQFYDFDDEDDWDEEDEEEMDAIASKVLARESFNLREALNQIDIDTYNKYDLLNLYESCELTENEKRALANIVYDQEDAEVIYDTLNNRYVKGEEIGMPERVKDGVIHESTDSTLQTCLNAWKKLEKNSPSYDEAIDLVTTAEQLVGYYVERYEEEAYSTYLGNRGILSNVTPEMDKKIIKLFNQITEIEWVGEYVPNPNDMGTYFDDIQPELEESVKKSLTEGFYRGCKGVTMIGHGEWSDPELEYDGYLFNYWDIEDALWNGFLDETGWTDVDGDEPVVENEFNEYVKARCVEYLDDCISGGAFTDLSIEGDIVDFPNGEYYYVGYEDGKISLDNAYNTGRAPEYSIDYDFNESIDTNLQRLYDYAIEKSPWLNGDDDDLDESKSIKESDEETPYTKEEVERELKSITNNFTDKDGDVKCGFEEEKKFGVEILRQHYRIVEVSGDDRREGTWYHISFAEPLNKNESVDPALLGDCPECGDKSFDTKKGKCTKCNYRE